MKKLFTASLFIVGTMLFSCEQPSDELFNEIDKELGSEMEMIEVDDVEKAGVGQRDFDSES